ncbi:MAG: ATP-binding protein [Phycisphaerales bacterium]|nr:ATP-binding protein [Phycisphaerales bacterium]
MPVSYATFERLKDKGVAAYRKGEYAAAKSYLSEAAECMVELAEAANTPELRRQREEIAAELIDLAKDCKAYESAPPGKRPRLRVKDDEDGNGKDASEWIVRDKPDIGFDDIAGLEDIKQEIRLKMIYPFSHPELAQRYGISVGGGLLLYGPPGTGKTMMAKAIAHEIDATFFVISPAQILSKWVGEAEQNVRKLFAAAKEEAKSVIFVDEIEALIPKRRSDSSTVMARVVPQILQEVEGFDRNSDRALLFVGATNKPWMLDEAVMRPGRFDTRVYVGLPDAPARFKLLEINLGHRPLAADVDLGNLCDRLDGYSGADIKSICQQAAQVAFMDAMAGADGRAIRQQDLLAVLERSQPSVRPADLGRFDRFVESGA